MPAATAKPPAPKNRPPAPPTQLATEYPQPEPVLHAMFTDPDGGTGRVLFTVYDPTGMALIRDAPGTLVSSGSDSSFTISVGMLLDGVEYSWTARSFDGLAYSGTTDEPNFVATSMPSITTAAVNPWGCAITALNPHDSSMYDGYIKAEAQRNCTTIPPRRVSQRITQYLYRSSWNGWRWVAQNDSWCDRGGPHGNAGQPIPKCNWTWTSPHMQAYVWWDCVAAGFKGDKYNYLNKATGYLYDGATTYIGKDDKATGGWADPGVVTCT
jgi:hypothetical protein